MFYAFSKYVRYPGANLTHLNYGCGSSHQSVPANGHLIQNLLFYRCFISASGVISILHTDLLPSNRFQPLTAHFLRYSPTESSRRTAYSQYCIDCLPKKMEAEGKTSWFITPISNWLIFLPWQRLFNRDVRTERRENFLLFVYVPYHLHQKE